MRQKNERKNGGFTLVEVLIAIMILGIICVPFMHSFVTASRTNSKARQLQNATAVATGLMEEVKANSIEDLAFQFNYPTKNDDDGDPEESRFDILDANAFTEVGEVRLVDGKYEPVSQYFETSTGENNEGHVTASVLYKDYELGNTDDYKYLGQNSGKYYFVMKGVEAGTGTYDALITMDANAYKTGTGIGYNEQNTPVVESVDVLQDAFYVQKTDQDATYLDELIHAYGKENEVLPSVLMNGNLADGEMKRTININIENNGTITKVYVEYVYSTYNFEGDIHSVTTKPILIYTNAESPGYDLRSIYLFYLPNYASSYIGNPVQDSIVVNNPNNVEADLHIAKQKHSSYNNSYYEQGEVSYYCELYVREGVGTFNTSTHTGYLHLLTNLSENIYNEGTGITNPYKLVYSNMEGTQEALLTNAKRILDEKPLDGGVVRDRIYEVSVSVYEEGEADKDFAGDPVATLSGSKDN